MILQKSFSYADLVLKKHLLSSMLKTFVLLNIFRETLISFRILWWIESSEEQNWFETEINIINILLSLLID